MLFSEKRQCQIMFVFILFTSITFCYTQTATTKFRSSNIELIPDRVVINSTSITNFTCINHEPNDLSLEVNLSKTISSTEIKIYTKILNKTAIHIQLESKNYLGIFHLLCFLSGRQNEGNRADIIVKAAPGVLQLVERCRVYDRQYIKCVIRAPTIARAIQNDYPPNFEFKEISHSSDQAAYTSRVEFLKNESTDEYLIFKWKPTAEGEFPNGIRMHMKVLLPHFDESSYYFDMTPVFRIKPKFLLQAISSSEIQIQLTSISPPALCEKNILSKITSNINQTWTAIESDRNSIVINNLLSNSIYRVCIKCRQIYTDPDGIEECQEIKTLNKFSWFFEQKFFFLIIIILIVILFISIGFVFYFWGNGRKGYKQVVTKSELTPYGRISNIYVSSPPHDGISNISIDSTHPISRSSSVHGDTESITEEINDGKYRPIASMEDVIEMCSSPKILSLSED